MKNLYKEELLEHFKYPRNSGTILNADITTEQSNPSCGDSVIFTLKLDSKDLIISEVKFTGVGCVISQAAASLLTEQVLNKNIKDVLNYNKDFILSLVKIELGPTRLRCALLPLQALQLGIKEFLSSK